MNISIYLSTQVSYVFIWYRYYNNITYKKYWVVILINKYIKHGIKIKHINTKRYKDRLTNLNEMYTDRKSYR